MRENDWTRVLGWPGYRVYPHEIKEPGKTLELWVLRKRGNRKLVCSGVGASPRMPATAKLREFGLTRRRLAALVTLHSPIGWPWPKLTKRSRIGYGPGTLFPQIALNCLPPRWYVATQRKAAPHFASTWDSGRNPLAPPSWQVRLRPRTLNAIPSTSGGGSLRKTNYHVDRTAGITPALYIRGNGHTHFGVGFCLYLPNAD